MCPMAFGDAILPRGVQLSLENFTRGCQIPRDAISSVTPDRDRKTIRRRRDTNLLRGYTFKL